MLLEKAIRKDTLVSSVKRFFLTPANFRLLFFVVLYCDIRYLSPVVYQTVILVMTLWSAVLMADQYIVKKRIMRVKFRRIIFVFLFFALIYLIRDSVVDLITLKTPTEILIQREEAAEAQHRQDLAQAQAAFEAEIHSLSDGGKANEGGAT